jgi:Tfp pilus assembly protein PilX
MTCGIPNRNQRGVVLIVGMIVLVLISLFVVAAYRMSTTNLAAVGNMQFRAQALAAAELAIERKLGLPISTTTFSPESVDLDGNGTAEFSVSVSRSCLRALPIVATSPSGSGSSTSLGFTAGPKEYLLMLDYVAQVTDSTTGANAIIHQGFKSRVSQTDCDTVCPPALLQSCT